MLGKGEASVRKKGMQVGKYKLGKTLGEGNFGKVKLATNVETGQNFAIKIIKKHRIRELTDQIKREIATSKLKHPNVVRLYEVLASKTTIYMVLEYVDGGELFNRIDSRGKLLEAEGRKLFQQLIDGVSYCHIKGFFHRDLKLENILVDANGNIKITDFGFSALAPHFEDDELLYTTCGSPNYVAPEVLANRGYKGAASDVWSCGIILYVILTGYLPFDDGNIVVLYHKISNGNFEIPKRLSPGAQNIIRRILDPYPVTRITMEGIKADEWFKQDYTPAIPEDEDVDINIDDEAFTLHDVVSDGEKSPKSPTTMNAFQLVGMLSCFDLSGFFEKEDVSKRKIRFASNYPAKDLLERIKDTVVKMGFQVRKKSGRLEVLQEHEGQSTAASLAVVAQIFEISPSLCAVELTKTCGDSSTYKQLGQRLTNDLGVPARQAKDF